MILIIIGFIAGDLYVQSLASLSVHMLCVYVFVVIIFLRFWYGNKTNAINKTLLGFLVGVIYTGLYASQLLSWELRKEHEATPVFISGYIASLPKRQYGAWQFDFLVDDIVKTTEKKLNVLIRLSWRTKKTIHVGQHWCLPVILKRIHATQSPGAFDYEAWALQHRLRAKGYVIAKKQSQLISHHWYRFPLEQFREFFNQRIKQVLPKSPTSVWLLALVTGEREGVPQAYWQVLRRTGTNHLMAIGGLHIGVISGFVFLLFSWLWRRSAALVLVMPAQIVGSIMALVFALFYALLAGFSIPTQRACLMLAVIILTKLLMIKLNPWMIWFFSLFVVLLFNPLNVLSESFWLSFMTIALIIYGMSGRLSPAGIWWKWGRVQWVIGIGLIPLTLLFFQEASLISFIANCIAIPWLSFLILPLCFVSALLLFISKNIAMLVMQLAGYSMDLLWQLLEFFARLPLSVWQYSFPGGAIFVLAVFAILLLLAPKKFPGRWLVILWLLPLYFYQYPRPENGTINLNILDVGQGLSVVVQTHSHVLVYDAGPRLSENSDTGKNIVLPFLYQQGIAKVDHMVISHGDNDHIGGANAILKALPVSKISTSVPDKFTGFPALYCLAGTTWQWDGVEFSFLYPDVTDLNLNNNSSCVLHIKTKAGSVLLTGDVEKRAEIMLLKKYSDKLHADILVAPHHGSKTSALPAFIQAVNPRYVIYATGYLNRYHFPHAPVVQAYTAMGVEQLDTAFSGSISFSIDSRLGISYQSYREQHKRYWFSTSSRA